MKIFKKNKAEPNQSIMSIVSNEDTHAFIQSAMDLLPNTSSIIKTSDDTLANAGQLVNGSADIVIIEMDMSDPRAITAIEKLNTYVGISGTLIVIAHSSNTRQMRNLFQMGVGDVLPVPIGKEDILTSVQAVLKKRKSNKARPASGRVMSVMKCGGGVGATMLATNMAHNISARQKTKSSVFPKTLLIDLDIQFGNVATILNLNNRASIIDLMKAEGRMDGSLVSAAVTSISDSFDVLASPDQIVPLSALTPDFVENLLAKVKPLYDYVILDNPTAWSGSTGKIANLADVILPVLHPTVEHAVGAQRFLEGLDNLKVERSKAIFVINCVKKDMRFKDRISNINKLTKRPSLEIGYEPKPHQLARDHGSLLHKMSGSASQIKQISKLVDAAIAHLNSVETDVVFSSKKTKPSDTLSLG